MLGGLCCGLTNNSLRHHALLWTRAFWTSLKSLYTCFVADYFLKYPSWMVILEL
jgi:hypothetical protein